jgi:hypothetical protein
MSQPPPYDTVGSVGKLKKTAPIPPVPGASRPLGSFGPPNAGDSRAGQSSSAIGNQAKAPGEINQYTSRTTPGLGIAYRPAGLSNAPKKLSFKAKVVALSEPSGYVGRIGFADILCTY